MKVINKEFVLIDKLLNIDQIMAFIKTSLEKMNIDPTILNEVLLNMDDLYIQVIDNDIYTIKLPNGSFKSNKISSGVGALKTNMFINVDYEKLNIIPGIVLRKNFNNHQFIHEILHAIASKLYCFFDENGITYTKTGTKISYYDRSLNDYEKVDTLSSDGLNEGITELLTSILTGEYTGSYAPFVIIAGLFMVSNNYLLNAYFMKDITGLEKFYKDIEEKQSLITRKDFINLSSKCSNFEFIAKIIAAGINYNRSYGKEMTEKELRNLVQYLDNNVILDSGSWYDLIINYKVKKCL